MQRGEHEEERPRRRLPLVRQPGQQQQVETERGKIDQSLLGPVLGRHVRDVVGPGLVLGDGGASGAPRHAHEGAGNAGEAEDELKGD